MSDETSPASDDIFFACPSCSKNMSIPREGAGLIVTCPQCEHKCRVPAGRSEPTEDTVPDMPAPPAETTVDDIIHEFDMADAAQPTAEDEAEEKIWDCVVSRDQLRVIFDQMASMHRSLADIQEILEKAMEG